ncbi:MAG: aminotransferase class I/II-fold pyridoxal phosphate-dependent enzyme, partial [Actinobacteria bacterium]
MNGRITEGGVSVTDTGLGGPIVGIISRLQPVLAFFTESTWSKRGDDPTICDFVAGNPHDMPIPGITDAIQKWAVPKTKDWYAYKPDVPQAREAAAKTLSAERGVTYQKEDVFLTPGTFGALSVVMRAILDRGDEVVYLSPPWFFYEAM